MAASSEPEADEDGSDIATLIARLTAEVDQIACEKAKSIQQITNQMKMLALNALIESSRAGALGAGFGVVAFHLTPGYETYRGLGWFGVIVR